MVEYIEREAVCYQLTKQATIDGQPRAIRRAAKIVAEFPAADVRPVVLCKNCKWCHSGYCEKYDDLIPFGHINHAWENWFCAAGERPNCRADMRPEPPKEGEL